MLSVLLAATAGGCHSVYGPTPVKGDWQVVDTAHYSFNVRPGSFAEQNVGRLAEVLEEQYDATLRALDIRYAGRVSLFLYESAADAGLASERSGTAYPDTETVSAAAGGPLDDNLFVVLSHEVNHVIEQNAIGRPVTSFMGEGLPSAALSERFHQLGRTFLYDWTARRDAQIPSLSTLVDDDQWDSHDQQVTYNASASFLAYLLETGGPQRVKQLQPLTSAEFGQRFSEIYGRSLGDAEREWRVFCAARGR
jgi:hypothetical protein